MPRIPTGIAIPVCYYVPCPHCGEALGDPATGSVRLARDSADAFRRSGTRVVTCYHCGEKYRLPAALFRL